VVEVRVGEQDGLDRGAELGDLAEDALVLVAGVDDDAALAVVGPGDVAVLLQLPDGQPAGLHQEAVAFFLRRRL
jgi:hypothetical protein